MLIFARVVAALTAVIAAVNILIGAMTDPVFLVPDWLLVGLLAAAAILPRAWAAIALVGALGYGLGVFSVALSSQILAEEINFGLAALIVADLLALGAAANALRRDRTAA